MPIALRSLSRKPKPRQPPEADPRFVKVMGELKQKTAKVKQHPAPAKKAAEAQAAAKGPANEKRAGAQANQVDKIKDAKTKKPEPTSFLALLRAEIQKALPKTLGDTEKFMKGGDAGAMKGSLKGNVAQQKQDATGDTATATKQAPNEGGVQAKPVTPIPGEPQPPAPDVNAAEGMPQAKPDADVSLQDSKQDTEAAMKDAEVTPDQLKKANDPRFSAVLSAKDQVAKQADTAPNKFRAGEKAALNTSVAQAKAAAKTGAAGMLGAKAKSKAGVSSKQEDAKKKDEQERQQVTDRIEGIFNKTKQQVEAKLNGLETEVNTIFDSGTDAALNAMKAYVEDRIFKYKLERYLSIPVVGPARWIKDQFMGLPDEVNAFYVEGKNLFTSAMDKVVVRVANLVETRLREAKALVAAGQAEIKAYVATLSPKLRSVGEAAQKKVADQFAELERGIEDKKNQLAQALAQKYKEAMDKADAALKEIQDSNKGLVQQFAEKLGEIIKILMEFKDKLMALLKKGADTIKLILADPIGFLGNLIAAIKQGISQFVGNIWTHLKAGFMKWLFGALTEAGIEIPAGLPSLPSILKLVLSVLGLTYERMRAKAVKLLGPTAVTIIEKAVEYVRALISGGPAALWEKIKEDLSNLKAMVIDAIQDWIITTIIKQATIKLLSMFNPAGAIVQAVLAIYNTVMFLIERASQIMAFVEAVINSVSAIAQGAIGGAAAWIERSLANAIPLVIGFLANLIGLGGISKKIKETINKIQGAVDKAIDKAIGKIIALVKKLFAKLTGKKKDKDGKPDERTDAQKQQDLTKAVAEANQALNDPDLPPDKAKKKLPAIKTKYKLSELTVVKDSGTETQETDHVKAIINPALDGAPVLLLIGMPKVDLNFNRRQQYNAGEYWSQLKGQEAGLNKLSVADWSSNRSAYLARKAASPTKSGRHPLSAKEQRAFRQLEKTRLLGIELAKPGMTQAQAEANVAAFMKGKAALHDPDQVAGGDYKGITKLGDTNINSSIGAQWPREVPKLDAAVAALKSKKFLKMNVSIQMTTVP
ncbi:MAG: polymorphic toxin type 15 domain-containing protein [Pyrinomonadaceae bacterium]